MRVRLWPFLVSALFVATVVEGAPPKLNVDDTHRLDVAATTRVVVHVYSQVVDFSEHDERLSLDVARMVFSTASVNIGWTSCKAGMCETPAAEVLKLRIAISPDRSEAGSGHLGTAVIDSRTRTGVLATVFIDRTRRLADRLGIDHRVLLGRAIAHELGHLLLGTSTHGSGLMRETWSHTELTGSRPTDWVLDPGDAAVIRNRLARRGNGRAHGAS